MEASPAAQNCPGDRILKRRMPNASDAEYKEARDSLKRLARVLLRMEDRLAREWYDTKTRESAHPAVDSGERTSLSL